jgi:flagellar biogenesis protein FliO
MDYVGQVVAVAAVLGLLGAVLAWARRRGLGGLARTGRPGGRKLEALERLSLGPQHTLHLVRMGEQALVVACSPAGCAVLEKLPAGQFQLDAGVGR